MQTSSSTPKKKQDAESAPAVRAGAAGAPRRIDCGGVTDDAAPHVRPERADARHAYLTARGTYAEQAQAV